MEFSHLKTYINRVYQKSSELFSLTKQGIMINDLVRFDAVRIALLRELAGIPQKIMTNLEPESLDALLNEHCVVDFLFSKMDMLRNPIPRIGKLVGPMDDFEDFKMGEFSFCETFYSNYVEERNIEFLKEMVAVLYRPERPGYDPLGEDALNRRQKFNVVSQKARLEQIKNIPEEDLIAIYLWYDCCRQQLMEDFPEPFEGESSGSRNGTIDILIAVSGNDPLKFHESEEVLVKIAFATFAKTIRESKNKTTDET
jgi:hypothetical protein